MEQSEIIALGIFSSYFVAIIVLFTIVGTSIYDAATSANVNGGTHTKNTSRKGLRATVFVLLAIGSLTHTWFYMFKYLEWSFNKHESHSNLIPDTFQERITSWLLKSELFEEAWAAVCKGQLNWWWSEQLCLFTVGPWLVFLCVEGTRRNIKYLLAYMLLGQLVAISVASNLFYAAIILADDKSTAPRKPTRNGSAKKTNGDHAEEVEVVYYASPALWFPAFIGILSVIFTPHTTADNFLLNLLAMHSIILIPLLSSTPVIPFNLRTQDTDVGALSININILYILLTLVCACVRFNTTSIITHLPLAALNLNISDISGPTMSERRGLMDLVLALKSTLYYHPAQSSIGWDIIWTSACLGAWVLFRRKEGATSEASKRRMSSKWFELPYVLLATPLSSIGVTAAYLYRVPEPEGSIDVEEKPKRE